MMLSRFVVSQVKHNSFFIVGFVFGLWLALTIVPLGESPEECLAQVVTEGGEDEYAPVREERPLGGGGPARALQRPRYYTTELGMRAPLLAAVLSSEAELGPAGRAAALNATSARLQPALRFFIAASTPVAPGLPNVVGFTDTREMLKPFHALKYLADNYLDEYNFFFLVSDGTFVNARRLSELVGALSVSQDVYMGTVAEDDSHYCTLEGGILLSNSVLRAVHNELDWCVRNSYSAHHHENIGRCVLHAAHVQCARHLQHHEYLAVRDSNPAPPVSLPDAVTAYPLTEPRRFHELHAYVNRVYLERSNEQVSSLRLSLQRSARRHPPAYRNHTWPRGLRDDPGLAPPLPHNRFDHLRWTMFNTSHALMPDDHRAVGSLTGATAKAVELVLEAVRAWARHRWDAGDISLMEGAWRWEPATALRYKLLLRLQSAEGSVLKYVEAVKPLGAARLVPVPYVTESARVWMVVPADAELPEPTLAFLRRYEAACLQHRANTALITVILRRSGTPVEAGASIRDAVRSLATKHNAAVIHSTEVEVTPDLPDGSAGSAIFARAALDAALPTAPRDALLLLTTPGMDFNEDFLNRVRMNSISGEQWFLPVPFARYAQYNHPRFLDDKGNKPQTNTGRFNLKHVNVLAVFRQDYETARSSAAPDAAVASVLARAPLRCIQAPEPGFILLSPPSPPCSLHPKGGEGEGKQQARRACLARERDEGFAHLDLGAKHTLAKLLLEIQSEQA